jgi:hypothetical protein
LPHCGRYYELNEARLEANLPKQKAHPNGGCAVTASWDVSAAPAELDAPVIGV